MSHEQLRTLDVRSLAQHAVQTLTLDFRGVGTTSSEIMQNSIVQCCLELEIVESILTRNFEQNDDPELCYLPYMVEGIRRRLEMAQHNAEFLATVLAEAGESEASQ